VEDFHTSKTEDKPDPAIEPARKRRKKSTSEKKVIELNNSTEASSQVISMTSPRISQDVDQDFGTPPPTERN
jgi:hypothetical protein